MVGFDLGPLLQGQMRIAKLNSDFNSLLRVLEVWDGKAIYRKSMGRESYGVVGFDLGPLLQGQTRIAKLKTTYNSLIIGRRGLGW